MHPRPRGRTPRQSCARGFDAALSRAVARLNVLCELCLPFVKTGGVFAAMKGPDCAEELREAERAIALLGGELERCVSYTVPGTDVTHSVVLIRKVRPTGAKYPRRWAQIKKQPPAGAETLEKAALPLFGFRTFCASVVRWQRTIRRSLRAKVFSATHMSRQKTNVLLSRLRTRNSARLFCKLSPYEGLRVLL